MLGRVLRLAGNVALSAGAIAASLLVLELVVFRYILVPDDLLANVSIDGVVRYKPDTTAVFRHPDGSRTTVTVNAQGWNSNHPTYNTDRTPGRKRVAIIGNSYVHAGFVDPPDAFPYLIERTLQARQIDAEVYRFGMDGAPLSQYLHVLRAEVLKYRPDVVVIPIIHNDFDEMYRGLKTRYASSFMKLRRSECGEVVEVPPADFRPGLADKLRRFATFRYLYYETNLYLHLKNWISKLYWGGNEQWDPAFVSAAVDIRKINDHDQNRFYARYVLGEMKALAEKHQFKMVFTMDAVREAIYDGRKPIDYEIERLNMIARDLTGELELTFVDLQPAFAMDYAIHGKRFEFSYDWHWNARANTIVAEQLVPPIVEALSMSKATTVPAVPSALPSMVPPQSKPASPRATSAIHLRPSILPLPTRRDG